MKRKYSILLPFFLIFAGVTVAVMIMPDTFVSTATLLIEGRNGEETAFGAPPSAVEVTIETITRQMMRRDTMKGFIDQCRLYEEELSGLSGAALMEKRELLIDQVKKNIRVELLTTGLVHPRRGLTGAPAVGVTLSYNGRTPEKALEMAKALTRFFLEKSAAGKSGEAKKNDSTIVTEIESQRKRADRIEKRLADFREMHKEYLPEMKVANEEALKNIEARINASEEPIAKNGGGSKSSARIGSNARVESLQNEKRELSKKRDELREKIEQASLIETEYRILLKDYENEKRLYHILTERGFEKGAIITGKQDHRPYFTLIDPPTLPASKNNYFKMIFLLSGLGVAVLAGLLSGLYREWTDDTIWTEADLKELSDKPILGVISKMSGNEGRIPKKEGLLLSSEDITYNQSKVCEVNAGTLKQNKLLSHFYGTTPSEEYNILKTRLLAKTRSNNHNTILVTSAGKGEGKSLTAANLALSLAKELVSTVLLVDADLKDPSIHTLFNITPSSGLSEYFMMNIPLGNLFINPGVNKLLLLPGNHRIENSAEVIGAPKMAHLILELKMRYMDRYVIIDSSSLNEYADAMILSNYVDGVILVVEARKTRRSEIQKAIAALENHNLIGLVLNKG